MVKQKDKEIEEISNILKEQNTLFAKFNRDKDELLQELKIKNKNLDTEMQELNYIIRIPRLHRQWLEEKGTLEHFV
jgi:hypothetical protein